MEKRRLGKTGFEVSVLGFGCGAVGGLMTNGDPADQERAGARALEIGINYFDTAAPYGNGRRDQSRAWCHQEPEADIYVGTKVPPPTRAQPHRARSPPLSKACGTDWSRSICSSSTTHRRPPRAPISPPPTCSTRWWPSSGCASKASCVFGITAVGRRLPLHRVADAGAFATAQVSYNLLNPSPGGSQPAGFQRRLRQPARHTRPPTWG